MKKPLALNLNFDIKTVRRTLALITGETFTDEQITKRFFEREPIDVDLESALGESEAMQLCLGLISIIIGSEQPDKPKVSAFQSKLEEIVKERNSRTVKK